MPEAQDRREFAEEVVVRLRRAGFQALWAGGCVRDLLIGLTPADYDVATDATPEQVMAALPFRSLTMGVSFGVVRVRHRRQKGNEVEIATFRSDLAYIDGRRPIGVVYSTPQEDAERRDFTINGMFMDPMNGEIIDYVGGRQDLQDRLLRAIGDPSARFEEDKLRLLRAVRFASRFDLQIEPTTLAAVQAMAGQVSVVSPERITQELRRMLAHRSRSRAMNALMDCGLLAAVLPPLAEAKGLRLENLGGAEGDLWDHLLLTLDRLPDSAGFPLTLAALLHHVGGKTADEMGKRLKLSNTEREQTAWLVTHHQSLADARNLPDARLKRILASPGIDDLLALHRAQSLATVGRADDVDFCEDYRKNQPAGPINPPPLLTGHDLVQHGLKPGVWFAAILETVRDAQLESRIQTRQEALELVDRETALHSADLPAPCSTPPTP